MGEAIRPKKSLGQHFLRDDEVHEEILRWARLTAQSRVLEIGAGDGTLTHSLGELAGRVIAVEKDRRCLPILRRDFPAGGNVEITEGDILEYDLSSLEEFAPLTVVGDLPYNIATAVLDRLLDGGSLFSHMVLMFQKEVALRLTAGPGSRDYGSLSLATQYRSEVELIRIIGPEAFSPPPRVDSALVHVVPRQRPLLPPEEERVFFRFIRAAFRHRRKTLLNSLSMAGGAVMSEGVAAIIEDLDLPENVRAEKIGLDQFLEISRRLKGSPGGSDD